MYALVRWGARSLGPPKPEDELYEDWGLNAFRAIFDPDAAEGLTETYVLDIDGDVFTARVVDGFLEPFCGAAENADLVVTTSKETFFFLRTRLTRRGLGSVHGPVHSMYRIMYNKDMPKSVPFSRARAELSDLLDEVEQTHEHVEITRNGRPAAILLSPDEFEVIQETLEILDDAEALDALRESEADVRAGRLHDWDEVRRELGLA